VIAEMRAAGTGLVYISHRMEEVWRLADRVTVLRDGALVGTREKECLSPPDVVRMMVGRQVDDLYRHRVRRPQHVLLDVHELTDGRRTGPDRTGPDR
jgi:ribose transport system ATP-binding protein